MIIGLNFFGEDTFSTNDIPVTNINYCELKNSIVDDVRLDQGAINTNNVKEDWKLSTLFDARFQGNLEAGNISANGLEIIAHKVKRRGINDINDITLATINNDNSGNLVYYDYTQPNDDLIYSIVPVSENGLEGVASSVSIKSDFCGFYIVDKDNQEILTFDTSLNSDPSVETQLNQGRIEVETMNKYPTVYYTEQSAHSFSLSMALIGDKYESTGKKYQKILEKFIYPHKPFLVKSGAGQIYICDISEPKISQPLNSWDGYDYCILTVQVKEIMSVNDYING